VVEAREKFRGSLLDVIAVFRLTPEHEVLLVTTHHQHRYLQTRLLEFVELAFDGVDRAPQCAFKPRILVQAELLLGRDDGCKMCRVHLEAVADHIDFLHKIIEMRGDRLSAQAIDVVTNRLIELLVAIDVFHVVTQQEVLLGPPALQQLDIEVLRQRRRRLCALRDLAMLLLYRRADQVDGTHDKDAKDAHHSDRHDLVREQDSRMKFGHNFPRLGDE
jgi:hypothetical protein